MENIFGKENWKLAGEIYDELFPVNQDMSNTNLVANTVEDFGEYESNPASVIVTINDQGNIATSDQTNVGLQISSYRNTNDWCQTCNGHYSNDILLGIPVTASFTTSMSSSLPTTPLSVASTSSSSPIIRNKKQIRKCCKEMKEWLSEEPRNFQKANDLFSKYSIEINESLNVRAPRSGRPRFAENQGALSGEQLEYYRSNYAVIKRCKRFIASFVNMNNNGFAEKITLEEFHYPYDIDIPTLRNRHHTQ